MDQVQESPLERPFNTCRLAIYLDGQKRNTLVAGIVSILDAEASQKVVEIRRQLEDELDVQTPIENHYPHFSYQVAEQYDDEKVGEVIQGLAREQDSFDVQTNGIGIFSDTNPLIVYIPVIRSTHLSNFHSRVWGEGRTVGTHFQDYYRPRRWIPHITIAPVERNDVPSVMHLLSEYSFYWEIEIDNIATIQGDAPNRMIEHRSPLGGVVSPDER